MRKLFFGIAVSVLAAALAAPSHAAEFKYTGIFRIRGITGENNDRNEDTHDGFQGMDTLARPRFHAITDGGKIWAIYELDFFGSNGSVDPNGNLLHGRTGGRQEVGVNRWVVDFAVPGTTLRARWGRTDYVSPDKQIYTNFGRSRNPGIAVYGKLFGPLTLSFFNTKISEASQGGNRLNVFANDRDNWFLGITWKAAPKVSITPWISLSHANQDKATAAGGGNTGAGYNLWFLALNAKAKIGILSTDTTGVFQTGEAAEIPRVGSFKASDVDVEAWAFISRNTLSLGKLKLGFNVTLMSGDDDDVPGTGGRPDATITSGGASLRLRGNQVGQQDKELGRFVTPGNGANSWFYGGQIATSRNWMSLSARAPAGVTNVSLVGDGRPTQLNGVVLFEVTADYQLTKTLRLSANVDILRSQEKAADQCSDANANGVCDQGEAVSATFTNEKNFGTEVDVGLYWFPYKSVRLQALAAYLFAGDYGKVRGGKAPDDTWQLMYELRHFF